METDTERVTFADRKFKVIGDMKDSDTEQLKLLCSDHTSHVKIKRKEITELLETLQEQMIFTANKYDFLIECLILIGRLDIAKAIGCNDHDIEVIRSNLKEYKSSAGLKSFTILLHTLAADMEDADVKDIISCLVSDSIPKGKRDNCNSGFQLMLLLRKYEHINEDNLQHLSAIVRLPNLQKKIKLYEEQTIQKYKMDAKPRGICLIFNNVNFKTLKKRTGSDVDRDELKKVFTSFHFEVTVFEDLTKTGMKEKLEEFASKDHTRYDCFVCCILSHGTEGKVYGVDDESLRYETVTSGFRSSKCKSLVGKPKLFFIEGCQGEMLLTETTIESYVTLFGSSSIPALADFLMAFATLPGYLTFRYRRTGAWFSETLCKVLNEHGKTTDLTDMLTLVNESVAKKEGQFGGVTCKQIPYIVSTLRKKLFFLDTL